MPISRSGGGYGPPAAALASYTTSFAATENPLSEGGRWVNGSAGGNWNDMQSGSGNAYGTTHTPDTYADNLAILQGMAANHYIEGVVWWEGGYAPSSNHEIELLVRFAIASGDAHGYEVLVNTAGGSDIVRWNGAQGDFNSGQGTGSIGAVVDGTVIRVEVVGTTITVKKDGASVMTATNITHASGNPGVGAFSRGGDVVLSKFGWKSITAGPL